MDSGAPRVDETQDRLELRACWGRWRGEPVGAVRGNLMAGAGASLRAERSAWDVLRSQADRRLP